MSSATAQVQSQMDGQRRPLRVLFVHPAYPNTFMRVVDVLAERPNLRCAYLIENRCRAIVKQAAPRVTCFGYDPDGDINSTAGYAHNRVFERGARRGVGVARALRAIAPRYRPDVIVGSSSNGCTLYLRGAVNSAIVSYCEHPGYFAKYARPEFPASFDQYFYDIGYRAMVLASLAYSDLGMVASEHAKRMFPAEVRAKVRVQSEGVPLPPLAADKADMRKKLGLPVDEPLVGFCGRTLEAVRGFDIFLKVMSRVWQARPDVRALVIGTAATIYGNEGMYLGQQSFKEYALEQTSVDATAILWRDFLPYPTFIGHLACLDLAILPTFEGASNWSFFDAMASGTPILTSNRTYIPELMDYGCEGYYFDPYDIDAYVRMTLTLLDQPAERARIGRNARERIRRDHTPERAADGYERIIYEAYELRRSGQTAGERQANR